MSPIGRVFIIINLVLAGAFVGFAGKYLQATTNYKKQLEDKTAAADAAMKTKEADLKSVTESRDTATAASARAETELKAKTSQLTVAEEENKDLRKRLDNFEAKVTTINGSLSNLSTVLENLGKEAKEMRDKYLAAEKAANEANQAKLDAEAKLAAAENDGKTKDEKIAAMDAEIKKGSEDLRVAGIELDLFRRKFPGFGKVVPVVNGRVENVSGDGRLVTLSLGESNGEIKPGATFAIYSGNKYKGEVDIVEVTNNNAFGHVSKVVDGAVVSKGDSATTRFQ